MDIMKVVSDAGNSVIEGAGNEIGTAIVTKIIVDKTNKFIQRVFKGKVTEKELKELEEMQQEYLKNCYKKNRYMNTIVLRGQKKTIDELYIPLTLANTGYSINYCINENGMDIFQKHAKILVIDNAGMGKSTIVKYFTMLNFQNIDRMPVVIELRNLKEVNSIEEYIQNEMSSIHREFPLQYVKDLLNGGDFIICFDGFDEVAESERENVIKMIKNFVSKANDNIFVLTSREDSALASFGEFKEFHIQGLKKAEAYQLIQKYSEADEYPNSVEIGQKLISKLKTENDISMLTEFLSNPLMVSLLYKTYLRYRNIPNKKHLFYKRVYTVLYEEHDLTKNGYQHTKKSGLDIEEMKTVLSYLGWYFVKNEIVECTEKELINIIEKVLKRVFRDKKVRAIDFLEDILQAVPFFIKEGEYCRWTHKSFSEYFAACFICNQDSKNAIKKILSEERKSHYVNVLDFSFDISEDIRNIIIYNLVENFIQYYNSSYQNNYFKQFDENLIKLKKGLEFWNYYADLAVKNNKIFSRLRAISNISNSNSIIILELFSRKNVNIFSSFCYNTNDTINNKDKDNLIVFIGNNQTKTFKYDDDKNNIVNSKEYVNYFTEILKKYQFFGEKMIDYDKCVAMKKSIEEYWAAQDDDIFD